MEILSKNFLWMAAANAVSGLFNSIIFIYLARVLLPEAFGYFSYAITVVFFLANFIDLGLSTYGIRETSKDRNRLSYYASEIISFKLLMAAAIFPLFALALVFLPHSHIAKIIMIESCLFLFIFAMASEWAFQGVEKMHMVFVSFTITPILQLLLIFLFVKSPDDLVLVPAIYMLGAIPIAVFFLRKLGFRPMIKGKDLIRIFGYLKSSIVIWSISIFAQIYNSMDVFLVGIFLAPEDVGYFSIARRAAGGAAIFMIFLANAALPRLAATHAVDRIAFKEATKRFLKVAVWISLLLFVPIIIFAKEIIVFTFGREYLPAEIPLKIMIAGLILVLFNMPYSTGLVASKLEKEVLKQSIASAILSVFLNFILIPKYGIIGASVSFLCAEILALIWILFVYKRRIGFA